MFMNLVEKIGKGVWDQFDELRHAAAIMGTVIFVSMLPRNWSRPIRNAFSRQVLSLGVEPILFVCGVSVFVGVSVVVQLAFWTGRAGQSQMLGPLLVAVVARELAPILTNVILIVRSTGAMATELGTLKNSGKIQVIEAQGIDPFLYLVLPRVLGLVVAAVTLTLVFTVVTCASGFLLGAWLGTGSGDTWSFANSVFTALNWKDMISILVKTILPACFTGVSSCVCGLGVEGEASGIPMATQRALTRSIAGLFAISPVVSLLTYLHS
jgi:phospholipid/cholesterol/gamma-HCH transport system permease protein